MKLKHSFILVFAFLFFSSSSMKKERQLLRTVVKSLKKNDLTIIEKNIISYTTFQSVIESVHDIDSAMAEKSFHRARCRFDKAYSKSIAKIPKTIKRPNIRVKKIEFRELDNNEKNDHTYLKFTIKSEVRISNKDYELILYGIFNKAKAHYYIDEVSFR